jgi:hypothetical protein
MRRQVFILTIFLFMSDFVLGQKTPEDLGKIVFNVFKTHDITTLDTLTPTVKEIIDIYLRIDSTLEFIKDPDFPQKYRVHDEQFKEKCEAIMNDTTELKIDWKNISLLDVKYSEKKIKNNESTTPASKSITINFLDIYLLSGQKKYLLQFKGIYKPKEIWKLGENMRIKEIIGK